MEQAEKYARVVTRKGERFSGIRLAPILGNDYGGVGIVARIPRKVKRVSPGSMVIYGTPHRWNMPCILVVNPSFHAKRGIIASIERGVQSVAVKGGGDFPPRSESGS